MSKDLVKERVIKYLVEDLLVPLDMIETDVSVSEFEVESSETLDIVINVKDSEDYFVPLTVIQCLDEDITLEESVINNYMDFFEEVDGVVASDRYVLTNGDEMMCVNAYDEEALDESFNKESDLPTYEEMIRIHELIESITSNHDHSCGCGSHDHHHHKHHHHDHHHSCGCKGHHDDHKCGCGGNCGCKH